MKRTNRFLVFLLLMLLSTASWGQRIIYPYRSTTAIVLSGSTFEVWLSTTAGQTVNSISLRGLYNNVDVTFTTASTDTWVYDQFSGKTCNQKLIVTVPANTPADKYDLLVNTSTGTLTSLRSVKVIKEYKSSYFVFHISDGHRWESITTRDSLTSLREQNAILSVANIIDPEILIETGDNFWGNNQTLDQKKIRAATYFNGTETIKGMNSVNAAVFTVPGNHDAHTNGWENTTVPVCSRDWNDLFGLENHSFKYGNARFIGVNNAWCPTTGGGAADYIPNYKWQLDEAIAWINREDVGSGNFRMSYQHVPQESLPPIYNRLKADGKSLGLMIGGHIHRYSTNPYSIDGKPIIYTVAIFGTASDNAPFNLYRIDNNAGTYTPYPNSFANNEATATNKNYSSIKLKLAYSKANDGANSDNLGTIVNNFAYAIPDASIRFVMPKGFNYSISRGRITQEFDGTDFHIVDVRVDLPANSTTLVNIFPTNESAKVTGLTLTPTTSTIFVGKTLQLIPTIAPVDAFNRTISWESSNASVANVNSDGFVTAISEGPATIKATTQDGGKTATSDITVSANPIITTIYLDECEDLTGWISTATLNTTIQKQGTACLENLSPNSPEFSKVFTTPFNSGATPENGQVKLWYWVSLAELGTRTVRVEISSSGVSDVDEYQWTMTGLVDGWNLISLDVSKASKIGTPNLAAINWFRIYSSGKTVGVNVTTRVDAIQLGAASTISGINDLHSNNNKDKSVNIYPNPLKQNVLSIDINGFEDQNNVNIRILNLTGHTVYQKNANMPSHLELDTLGLLNKSAYIISVKSGQSTVTSKFFVN